MRTSRTNVRAKFEALLDRELSRVKRELLNSFDDLGWAEESERSDSVEDQVKSTEGPETLVGSVKHLFKSSPFTAWSVATLERKLKEGGFVFGAKNPRSSLNTVLTRLAEDENPVIELFKRGSGRSPNLYRAKAPGNASSLSGRWLAIPVSDKATIQRGDVEDGGEDGGMPIPN
jgi:hypothetical protein